MSSRVACVSFALAALVGTAGCKRLARLDRTGEAASSTSAVAAGPPAASTVLPEPDVLPSPPEGYVAMKVIHVIPTGAQGHAVVLEEAGGIKVVPIFVGGTEALSIELRQEGKRYRRPLTHDLLDALVAKLGGQLVKVHVDDLVENTFVGRVFVRHGGRVVDVDARPSDAIALALGSGIPIYVARKVIDVAGVRKQDLLRDDGEVAPSLRDKPRPDPISL